MFSLPGERVARVWRNCERMRETRQLDVVEDVRRRRYVPRRHRERRVFCRARKLGGVCNLFARVFHTRRVSKCEIKIRSDDKR